MKRVNDEKMNNYTAFSGKAAGLSSLEAERLILEGRSNRLPNSSSKSIASIFFGNIFTYFNAIFFGLAFLVIMVGAYRNLTFLPVVFANMIIGIVQQLRAKKVLDALSLLDVTEYTAIRDGKPKKVDMEKLVLGDVVELSSGQQIPADAEVIEGRISVNEALLTGEADEIEKEAGSTLMSGSFVISGSCRAVLNHVGADSYAARLTSKAKEVKKKKSEMIKDIETIILVAGIIIIPIAVLMVINSVLINGQSLQDGIVAMVGAVVGMIPEGLYLLLTAALTMSAARLAGHKVLLHDMKSIETLARVDVLCVDKTGTITSEIMTVTDIFLPAGGEKEVNDPAKKGSLAADKACAGALMEDTKDANSKDHVLSVRKKLLSGYIHTVPDNNLTMNAMREHFKTPDRLQAVEITPFSSSTKYSEIRTEDAVYRFGAPEFILSERSLQENRELINVYAGKGHRVLAFVQVLDEAKVVPLLFVSLANEIRPAAPDIFTYFEKQGVEIKVISGDNPLTVSRVAKEACIAGAERYVDASGLINEEDYLEAVQKYTVFGRVKPEQKKSIIDAIKKNGQKVAMTGDGVNDILAMKEADCSIAMGGGSDAARQAAQVVLMDSDFSHMKQIVSEGRRIINNMTRSGILFLYKNIFSFLLALTSIILTFHYPLKPTQISLISMFNIGLPGFLLAMEDNTVRRRGRLLTRTLKGALPAAVFSYVAVSVLMLIGPLVGMTNMEIGVAGTYLLSTVGFVLLWRLLHPLNLYRIVVFMLCILGMVISIISLWDVFILAKVSSRGNFLGIIYAAAGAVIMWLIHTIIDKRKTAED